MKNLESVAATLNCIVLHLDKNQVINFARDYSIITIETVKSKSGVKFEVLKMNNQLFHKLGLNRDISFETLIRGLCKMNKLEFETDLINGHINSAKIIIGKKTKMTISNFHVKDNYMIEWMSLILLAIIYDAIGNEDEFIELVEQIKDNIVELGINSFTTFFKIDNHFSVYDEESDTIYKISNDFKFINRDLIGIKCDRGKMNITRITHLCIPVEHLSQFQITILLNKGKLIKELPSDKNE